MKKKIIFLGGSHFQVFAYEKAKKMGYETICIDFIKDSPGHKLADYSFVKDATEVKTVEKIAKKFNVSAIIPYASDPVSYTANYVSKILNLKHNNINSIKILSNKLLFRKFQKKFRLNYPNFIEFKNEKDLFKFFITENKCVLIKPVDSSGSKGISIVKNKNKLISAVNKAFKFSKIKKVLIEGYIEKDGFQIAGDAFIYNSRIVNLSLANEHFSKNKYPVPIGESFPYKDTFKVKSKIKKEVQKIITKLKFDFGPINLDIRVKNKKIYIMEIGPRSGGNLIPQAIKYYSNFDQIDHMIRGYLKESINFKKTTKEKFCSTYIIHSERKGYIKKIFFSSSIQKNIIAKYLWKKKGDLVYPFYNSSYTIGACILKFKNSDEMMKKMKKISELIKVKI